MNIKIQLVVKNNDLQTMIMTITVNDIVHKVVSVVEYEKLFESAERNERCDAWKIDFSPEPSNQLVENIIIFTAKEKFYKESGLDKKIILYTDDQCERDFLGEDIIRAVSECI